MKKSSKKEVSKKTENKGKVTKIIHESTKEIKIEGALIENFIALQKVMVNLSAKFDGLSGQISKLLELFEISARSLARKDFESGSDKDIKKVMEKIDNLTQQAGLIGRGLALIHEANSEKYYPERQIPSQPSQQRPMTQIMPKAAQLPTAQSNAISQTLPKITQTPPSKVSELKEPD